MTKELKPCPCCKGKAKIEVKENSNTARVGYDCASIECTACGLKIVKTISVKYSAVDEVVRCWNMRDGI